MSYTTVCAHCSTTFQAGSPLATYCSDRCRTAALRKRRADDLARLLSAVREALGA